MINIAITGSGGYIGQNLIKRLKAEGFNCIPINRHWLYSENKELTEVLIQSDVVINLAGASILQRWTKKTKQSIHDSRIKTTQNLTNSIRKLPIEKRPKKFITASAIGIYEINETHNENSTRFSKGFIGEIVKNWEAASKPLSTEISRTVFRIGLVIGKEAKTVKSLIIPVKLGLGAKIGNGKQPFPFIHIDDLLEAFLWSIKSIKSDGTYNLVASEQISNETFTKTFAKILNRFTFLSIPESILKLVLGEASSLLTESATVIPQNLKDKNFNFQFPTINSALEDILKE